MDNRFKFRYFCNTTKFIGEVKSFNLSSNYAMVRFSYAEPETPDDEVNLSDGILMQCTGQRDQNGKLIYEGDIITGICSSNPNNVCQGLKLRGLMGKKVIGYIRYSESFGQFYFTDDGITFLRLFHGLSKKEVIGNIYENQNLLANE
jgi:uncharacterized phage protein (TIGR01671 family)